MMTKSKIKYLLMRFSGLTSLKWTFLPNGLYCFNYHRIGDAETCQFDPNVFSCTAEHFEQHLLLFKQHFTVIDTQQLVSIIKQGTPIDRRYALITFDDGYIDNYDTAFPLLKKHKLSATFFIVTSYVEEKIVPWWDEIAWLVKHSKKDKVQLSHWDSPVDITKGNYTARVRRLLLKVKTLDDISIEDKLKQLRKLTESKDLPSHGKKLFADWKQLKEMAEGGMTIGSHTTSHNILSHLSEDKQQQELFLSKKLISEKIGSEVDIVAYPVGGSNDFTHRTQAIAKECGYQLGFSFISGINTTIDETDRFCIKRISVNGDVTDKELQMELLNIKQY